MLTLTSNSHNKVLYGHIVVDYLSVVHCSYKVTDCCHDIIGN